MTQQQTVYKLRNPEFIDLSEHWKFQKRDREGMWAKSGGGSSLLNDAERVADATAKVRRRETAKAAIATFSSASTSTTTVDSKGNVTREAKQHEVRKVLELARTKEGRVTAQIEMWEATHEERKEMLVDTGDPFPDLSEAGLFDKIQNDNEQDTVDALKSLKVREERYSFLREAATNGLATAKAQDTVAKWDTKIEALPGGKGFTKLRDRLLTEKHVIGVRRKIDKAKDLIKDAGVHAAVLGAIAGLGIAVAGVISLQHGGDIEAFNHAREALHHWLTSGDTAVLKELGVWVGLGSIAKAIGQRAARLSPAKRKQRKRDEAKALEALKLGNV